MKTESLLNSSEILSRNSQVFKKKECPSETQIRFFFGILCFTFWLFYWIEIFPESLMYLNIHSISEHIFYLNMYFTWNYFLPEHVFIFFLNIYFTWTFTLFTLPEHIFDLNKYLTWTYEQILYVNIYFTYLNIVIKKQPYVSAGNVF